MTTGIEPLADARDMSAAHTMFRREFGLMPGLVRAVTAGDRQRAALVGNHIALVSTVLSHHHSGEDRYIWPRLLERCPQECASIVGVMEDQHETIHLGLLDVQKALDGWRDSPSGDARDDLADALDQLLPAMYEHLVLEEERVVPLIEKYITHAEYARVGQDQVAEAPPDELATVFGMFMYDTAPEVIELVVADLPAEIQPVIRDLAANSYAAYAQQLYGTATPGRVTG